MNQDKSEVRRAKKQTLLLERMVANSQPVLFGVGMAFCALVITLLISISEKFP